MNVTVEVAHYTPSVDGPDLGAEMPSGADSQCRLAADRANAAADRAVEAESLHLAAALDRGNVQEIEEAFSSVFRRIYLQGYEDGLGAR